MQPQQQGYASMPPAGYAPQPTYGYLPQQTVVVETVVQQQRTWSTGIIDPCGGPEGGKTCMYVCFCAPCAAGDVAAAAGRSYIMSCCIVPWLMPCCAPGCYAQDREALGITYSIRDELGCLMSCFLFWAGCGLCLICQEVAQLKTMGYYGGSGATYAPGTTFTVVTNPPQQVMYAAPVAVAVQPGYNSY